MDLYVSRVPRLVFWIPGLVFQVSFYFGCVGSQAEGRAERLTGGWAARLMGGGAGGRTGGTADGYMGGQLCISCTYNIFLIYQASTASSSESPRSAITKLDLHGHGTMSAPSLRKNSDTRDKLWLIMLQNAAFPSKTHDPPEQNMK